jgi:hypothetical protein
MSSKSIAREAAANSSSAVRRISIQRARLFFAVDQQGASLDWIVWWDIHRRHGKDQWSRAVEKTEAEAVERARRFLKLGFVVYEIRDDKGAVFMDEAQITQRFGTVP